jgi:adenylate cyclase
MQDSLPQRLMALFAELRRRRVVRVATVYGVVGLAVMEGSEAIIPALHLPDSLISAVVILVLVGFPVAVGIAWAFDFGERGLVRTPPGDGSVEGIPPGPILSARSWAAIIPALVVIVVLLFWSPFEGVLPGSRELGPAEYLDSVAVMPLRNDTGLQRMDALGIGLAEEIIAQLQRIRLLKTTGLHSARAAAAKNLPLQDLGRQLGVQQIVLGEIDTTGTGLSILLYQRDVATGIEVWRYAWQVPLEEPDAARDTIAWEATRRVLDTMPGVPRPEGFQDVQHGPGQGPYQIGTHWLGRRTPEGLKLAIENFVEAILLDETNARAWSDLSSAYALALTYRYDIGLDAYSTAARSLTLAERALQRNPGEVGGYASRGYIGALINAPLARVNTDFRRAIELQPNGASVASWSARALERAGQTEEALMQAERAAELDPLAAGRHIAVAYLSLQLGNYDRAIEASRVAQEIEPELMLSRAIEGRALLLAGRGPECATLELGPHEALRATCLWETGRTDEADRLIGRVEALTLQNRSLDPDFAPVLQAEDLAVHYAWIGDTATAVQWIERAYELSPTGLEIRVYDSALFDRVRDPAFVARVDELRGQIYRNVLRLTL